MIPYDDLVAALSAWRARQGLPVSTMGGGAAVTPTSGSGPYTAPKPAPPPLDDDALAVDDAEMIDEQDDEGGDFAVAFGQKSQDTEDAPDRPTDPNDFGGGGRRNRGDW